MLTNKACGSPGDDSLAIVLLAIIPIGIQHDFIFLFIIFLAII